MAIIGIDLGTTNSLAAVWKNGESVLIPNSFGEYLTPSVVSLDEDNKTVYIGKIAAQRMVTNPKRSAAAFKRNMGRDTEFFLGKRSYRAEELSALVLRSLKEDAERFLGESVDEAVISVPAYFNDDQRIATKKAGELAGLRVERIVNEPSAAALMYQLEKQKEDSRMMVFDFGGGTLDVTVVECMEDIINVVGIAGDNQLGGRDFDRVLAEYFCKQQDLVFADLRHEAAESLLQKCERVKQSLSNNEQVEILWNYNGNSYNQIVTRETLVHISAPLFRRIAEVVHRVLKDTGFSFEDIDEIVMVGGSSKMAVVQQYMRYLTKKNEIRVERPNEIVALGVGAYTAIKQRTKELREVVMTDICPFSLGVGTFNKNDSTKSLMSVIIERNTPLPVSRKKSYYTVEDYQKSVSFGLYQGEQYYADDNKKLGRIKIKVPKAPAGEESVEVTFNYDINGILVVKVKSVSTGEEKECVLCKDGLTMSEAEKNKRIRELKELKSPQDDPENQYVTELGKRLYMDTVGAERDAIKEMMGVFLNAMEHENGMRFAAIRERVKTRLESIESDKKQVSDDGAYKENWYEQFKYEDLLENLK